MFDKITDFGDNCVSAAPDTLTGTAAENKAVFDRAVKNVVAAAFNKLAEECADMYGRMNGIDETIQSSYRGMAKLGEAVLSSENAGISLNIPVTRGYALLTWEAGAEAVSGKPIGYLIDANGSSQAATAYASGMEAGTVGYYMMEFEIFSKVARVSSYAVFSKDGTPPSVTVTDKAVNTGGTANGVKFYFSGKFPVGTRLELWGE